MRIVAAGKSDVGRRREGNEDSFLVDTALGLFVVCDGMGGHAAGEVASRLALQAVHERVRQRLPSVTSVATENRPAALAEMVRDAVERANARVHALGRDPETRGAGTTVTALVTHGEVAAMAHVGDTRLYLLRSGTINQISNDHTFVAEGMRRGLSYEAAAAQFGTNMLSRAVGPAERVDIDTLVFDILPGDKLLLCTDGLHGYFPDPNELSACLDSPSSAPDKLIALANERGGEDNITAVVLEASLDGSATLVEEDRASRVSQDLRTVVGIELLRELSYSEVLEVASVLRARRVTADSVVLKEGEISSTLYIIVEGRVQVERGGKKLAELAAGGHFGEMALLTNRPRSATIRALEECRLLALDREQLYPLFQQNPIIAVKFLWNLAVRQSLRLDELTEWLASPIDQPPDTVVDAALDGVCASPYSLRR